MITITEHHLTNGRKALIGVTRTHEPYVWLVTLDLNDGKGDVLYRVVDTVSNGYTVQKIAGGPEYRVHLGRDGQACSCPDARYRNRHCKHCEMAAEVAKHW